MLTEWNRRLNDPQARLMAGKNEIDDQLELNMMLVEGSFPVRADYIILTVGEFEWGLGI